MDGEPHNFAEEAPESAFSGVPLHGVPSTSDEDFP